MFQCPKCKESSNLRIYTTVSMCLSVGAEEEVWESDQVGDTEWDDESKARCADCEWEGTVKDISHEEYEEEEEAQ